MMDWFHQLPVVWMGVIVFAGIAVATALIYCVVLALAARGWTPAFKAVSPVMLTPLAVIFGLIVGFLCAQVWNDGERASGAVIREAGALRTVLLLATIFPDPTEARIRALVRRHIQDAVDKEWPAMARQQTSLPTINAVDIEALEVILSMASRGEAQATAQSVDRFACEPFAVWHGDGGMAKAKPAHRTSIKTIPVRNVAECFDDRTPHD